VNDRTPQGQDDAKLRDLALLFTKLGFVAFGGPAAHIAMMRAEIVGRLRWMGEQEFLDLMGASNLIPGPNSTELAIHIGRVRAGWRGLLVAGTCFILPAFLIVLAAAILYVRYGSTPQAEGLLFGITPVVVAIVAHALWGFLRQAVKGPFLATVGIGALVLYFVGVGELLLLFGSALLVLAVRFVRTRRGEHEALILPLDLPLGLLAAPATLAGTLGIFVSFLKIGSVLFGSGYVLLAFLRSEFVDPGLLTYQQLLDAVAVGQVTPGPVFTTATFIGYLLGGSAGALVATLGIFLPAFVFVALSGLALPYLRRSVTAGAVLDGVNVASLALMAVVTVQLTRTALVDPPTIGIALVSAVALLRFRVNAAWLVVAGALMGLAATRLQ
jgi:chromate transporter